MLVLLGSISVSAEDAEALESGDEIELIQPAAAVQAVETTDGAVTGEPHASVDNGTERTEEEPDDARFLEAGVLGGDGDESLFGSLSPDPVDPEQRPGLDVQAGEAPQLRVNLTADGSRYLRFAAWLQLWFRGMKLNPGTTVLDEPADGYADVAIRLSLIHISEPTRPSKSSRMPSSA